MAKARFWGPSFNSKSFVTYFKGSEMAIKRAGYHCCCWGLFEEKRNLTGSDIYYFVSVISAADVKRNGNWFYY